MTLHFTRWRTLPAKDELASTSQQAQARQTVLGIGDLSDLERRQLVACAGRGSELRFTVEELFADDFAKRGGDCSWISESTQTSFEWWDIVDDKGVTKYEAWFYHADGALVFDAGTTTVIVQGIQFGSAWEIEGEISAALQKALTAAQRKAIAGHPKSGLAQHDAFEP